MKLKLKISLVYLVIYIFIISCKTPNFIIRNKNDMELEESIKEMIIEDQNIQKLIIKNDKYEIDSLENRKKEIIKKNCDNCKNILNNYGYPTIDLVSKKTSHDFWVLVQHCDADIELQMKALAELKKGVKKGVGIRNNYAYLLDRVKVNLGEKQIFGTQVYRNKEGKYIPYPIKDSLNVNDRRKKYDIDWTIEEYLNIMNNL